MRARRRFRPSVPLVLAALLVLGGCDAGTPEPPRRTTPPAKSDWTVTHILIAHSGSPSPQHKTLTRTKATARTIATSLLADLRAGRAMDEAVEKYTDDRNNERKPNTNNGKPGSYTFGPGMMVPAFEAAAKATPVGQFTAELVETEYGFHLIRRDR